MTKGEQVTTAFLAMMLFSVIVVAGAVLLGVFTIFFVVDRILLHRERMQYIKESATLDAIEFLRKNP